jgi:hypothetical protein
LACIPDAANGNFYLVERRIQWLTTLLPGVPGLPRSSRRRRRTIHQTANGHIQSHSHEDARRRGHAESLITQSAPGTYDLDSLLREAQDYVAVGQWNDAIDTLDVIIGTDSNFQRARAKPDA